ncbi:MAG: zinc ABC transporter substrate-binding protein [Actinobacteria bacterium]|nr:zinc ABC transporter substrate-binding protein [Actinomycetota bacterium]
MKHPTILPLSINARRRPLQRNVGALLLVAGLALGSMLVGACGGSDDGATDAGVTSVAASFYPIAEAAGRVGGDCVEVVDLTPEGMSPHDAEPTPQSIAALQGASVAFYLGSDFQPQVQRAVDALPDDVVAIDLLEVDSLRTIDSPIPGVVGEVDGEVLAGGRDPHMWVDPVLFSEMVRGIQDGLVAANPGCADAINANAEAYLADLAQLDEDFVSALATCETRTLVTSHAAFGYLADRYGLKQAPIAGISPEQEPNAQSLRAVAEVARADGVKTVFFEELVPPDLAEVVASEIGAQTAALDPVEGLPSDAVAEGESYVSIQRRNLDALRQGLGCTA